MTQHKGRRRKHAPAKTEPKIVELGEQFVAGGVGDLVHVSVRCPHCQTTWTFATPEIGACSHCGDLQPIDECRFKCQTCGRSLRAERIVA